MVERPLEDIRPIGPIVSDDDSDDESDESLEDSESAIVEQAESWFQSISDESKKRKMMVEYIYGITDEDITRQDAEEIVSNSGL